MTSGSVAAKSVPGRSIETAPPISTHRREEISFEPGGKKRLAATGETAFRGADHSSKEVGGVVKAVKVVIFPLS